MKNILKLTKLILKLSFSHIFRSYSKDHSMLQTRKPVTRIKMHGRHFVPSSSPYTLSLHQVSLLCHAVVLRKKSTDSKKMIQGESPRIIFDLVTTRFEDWYNPNIIYDASCRVKEMGLNREPERFMNILITSDLLHIGNIQNVVMHSKVNIIRI